MPELPHLNRHCSVGDLRRWIVKCAEGFPPCPKEEADAVIEACKMRTGDGGMEWTPERLAVLMFLSDRLASDRGVGEDAANTFLMAIGQLLAGTPETLQNQILLDLEKGTMRLSDQVQVEIRE